MIAPLILKREHKLPFGSICNLSQDKLVDLCEYIDGNFEKRFIWHSKSLASAWVLFVKMKDESLQMCVDYHWLNWFTKNNWYPLPLVSRLLDQINHVKVYTKIDLCGAYNSYQICCFDIFFIPFMIGFNF
jgi:hypothetical protein